VPGRVQPALRLAGVSRVFGGAVPVRAVDDVSLTVEPGAFVAVVGRSGSGKTTLLSLMGLLDTPDSGTIEIEGRSVHQVSESEASRVRRERIGFVFQRFHLIPRRTVAENIGLALRYTSIGGRERILRVNDMIDRLGLGGRRDADVRTLSGGEQQRVAIGRALVGEARILLCDEPTGNLDSATGMNVLEILSDFNARGVTVVVVTHDPLVAEFARSRITMHDGKVT